MPGPGRPRNGEENVLADEVGRLLKSKGLTIAVAESCTGGRLGDAITDTSGSSDYFLGGVISYSNESKEQLLGVDQSVLRSKGAVSEEVAIQMASGVRSALNSKIGVGITGIAGPSGGTAEKPVGLVYIAVCSKGATVCTKNVFDGSRTEVKKRSVTKALDMISEFVSAHY